MHPASTLLSVCLVALVGVTSFLSLYAASLQTLPTYAFTDSATHHFSRYWPEWIVFVQLQLIWLGSVAWVLFMGFVSGLLVTEMVCLYTWNRHVAWVQKQKDPYKLGVGAQRVRKQMVRYLLHRGTVLHTKNYYRVGLIRDIDAVLFPIATAPSSLSLMERTHWMVLRNLCMEHVTLDMFRTSCMPVYLFHDWLLYHHQMLCTGHMELTVSYFPLERILVLLDPKRGGCTRPMARYVLQDLRIESRHLDEWILSTMSFILRGNDDEEDEEGEDNIHSDTSSNVDPTDGRLFTRKQKLRRAYSLLSLLMTDPRYVPNAALFHGAFHWMDMPRGQTPCFTRLFRLIARRVPGFGGALANHPGFFQKVLCSQNVFNLRVLCQYRTVFAATDKETDSKHPILQVCSGAPHALGHRFLDTNMREQYMEALLRNPRSLGGCPIRECISWLDNDPKPTSSSRYWRMFGTLHDPDPAPWWHAAFLFQPRVVQLRFPCVWVARNHRIQTMVQRFINALFSQVLYNPDNPIGNKRIRRMIRDRWPDT